MSTIQRIRDKIDSTLCWLHCTASFSLLLQLTIWCDAGMLLQLLMLFAWPTPSVGKRKRCVSRRWSIIRWDQNTVEWGGLRAKIGTQGKEIHVHMGGGREDRGEKETRTERAPNSLCQHWSGRRVALESVDARRQQQSNFVPPSPAETGAPRVEKTGAIQQVAAAIAAAVAKGLEKEDRQRRRKGRGKGGGEG